MNERPGRAARLVLLAYPASFRRDYGDEWARSLRDLRTHGGLGRWRLASRVSRDVLLTAPRMRWEALMGSVKVVLTVVAAAVALFALVLGSGGLVLLGLAVVALALLLQRRFDRPIAVQGTGSLTAQWYGWLIAAAALFAVGFGALATADDGELGSAAWATWMLSWATAAVTAVFGLGLGVVRLFNRSRS